MYNDFFGFSLKPFEPTPDPNFLYLSNKLRDALTVLEYGIIERRGFILLIGEPGTGKTTLINNLIDQYSRKVNFAYIFNPALTFKNLLNTVLAEFELAAVDENLSQAEAMHRLNTFAIEQFEKDRNTVIVVDEAQYLTSKTLENLRMLSNLETRKHKLIQIIISGQPELNDTLSDPGLRQLSDRIGQRCRTGMFNKKDAFDYIQHRLIVAGYDGPEFIDNKAKELVWTYSKGIPRVMNILCDNALLLGFTAGQKEIDSSVINRVIQDFKNVPLVNKNGAGEKLRERQDMQNEAAKPLQNASTTTGQDLEKLSRENNADQISQNPKIDQGISFEELLGKFPPGKLTFISNLGVRRSPSASPFLLKPRLNLFCSDPPCNGTRYFDTEETQTVTLTEKWSRIFMVYTCSNCRSRSKIFALLVRWNATMDSGEAVKLGEWPPFGPPLGNQVLSLVGPGRELFLKGRRAEIQGLGIGSFSYYRRMLISGKEHLIDEIIKVMHRSNAYESNIEKMESARAENQFENIAELSKGCIPEELLIQNENPVVLLDKVLTKGTYAQSDQEFLKLAGTTRLILTELADKLSKALQNKSEINAAINYLMDL